MGFFSKKTKTKDNDKLRPSGTWYHPNGQIATYGGGTWYHANGRVATYGSGTWYHANGRVATYGSGTWYHANGQVATYNSDGHIDPMRFVGLNF